MGNFRDNRGGGGRGFGRRDFGSRGGGDREMFKAVCSNCGKNCEVPFRPTGSKPVLCSDCFRNAGGNDSRRSEGRDGGRQNFRRSNDRERSDRPQMNDQFEALNAKLDKILSILGEATPAKPKKAVKKVVKEEMVEPEISVPQEEKPVEELQLQPEEPIVISEEKPAPEEQ